MFEADLNDLFYKSLARVTGQDSNEKFFDAFYERFLAADPEIAKKFEKTDLRRQKSMMGESLMVMVRFFATNEVTEELDALARIHGSKRIDIPSHLYDVWFDCIVDTVKEMDPEADDRVLLAWRVAMAPGVAFMKWANL